MTEAAAESGLPEETDTLTPIRNSIIIETETDIIETEIETEVRIGEKETIEIGLLEPLARRGRCEEAKL